MVNIIINKICNAWNVECNTLTSWTYWGFPQQTHSSSWSHRDVYGHQYIFLSLTPCTHIQVWIWAISVQLTRRSRLWYRVQAVWHHWCVDTAFEDSRCRDLELWGICAHHARWIHCPGGCDVHVWNMILVGAAGDVVGDGAHYVKSDEQNKGPCLYNEQLQHLHWDMVACTCCASGTTHKVSHIQTQQQAEKGSWLHIWYGSS